MRVTREPSDRRLRRLLQRFADGDNPRASYAEFYALQGYAGIGRLIQLESALAADRSAGNVITSLHSGIAAGQRMREEAARWLADNPEKTT